ncbi:crossover junction endonuclease MUS81 [Blastomyces dermatitidis ER-3]|uniref:Crossover junction endonuclease MUS81 n=2 Tax=Ajellomyces dermatitidis TaxID=5039 RepID=F2TPE2_AJEDA|nr:crossover junction endonuclease MUS81 [Blastomyces dermatitidis ER-3]EEQ84281.1 crossover junction endonuclease MUS81 [Blastomyces dermatitidis ER-3]EGE85105.2 crossover junction endonuclease MUS81 [Blastomyces dermatitidis ATCC 18188]EQL33751.1 crossover junction endonuclease MUS81 [Blastomyces dermatitidis ATCC 26199]
MADNPCANPLLLLWIKEWLDEARERNSKGVNVYKKAYDSMKVCPIPFNHPSEAQQLHGFGPKLCDRLTAKLQTYCEQNGLPMPELPHQTRKRNIKDDNGETQPAKRPKKVKPYVPALRSGPYGLLLGLANVDENSSIGFTKQQLIELAQPYCDSSYTVPPDPSKFYTAWNSMKTLVQKDLVYEHGRPSSRRYLLTDEGWEIARRIKKTLTNEDSTELQNGYDQSPQPYRVGQRHEVGSQRVADISPLESGPPVRGQSPKRRIIDLDDSDSPESSNSEIPRVPVNISTDIGRQSSLNRGVADQNVGLSISAPALTLITLPPDSFTVELVLDVREIRAVKDRDYIANELTKKGISPIVRSLEVGDVLWVAKCKDPNFLARHGEEGDEVMLDWIVERKRLDDLIGSIKDGRFHEQKFRLRRSGVQNVIYLIEDFADAGTAGTKYYEHVTSAIASTQVVNGYFVKQTRNLDDTIRYLARMTKLLRGMYTSASGNTGTTKPSPLSIIQTKHLTSSQSYLDLVKRLRSQQSQTQAQDTAKRPTFTVTFSAFSSLASKSEMLTLRDIFLKMLMCTRGVTADKALEIQRHWRTPREFVEAFEEAHRGRGGDVAAMENMVFEKLGGLVGRKKIGKLVSKKIAEVWGVNGHSNGSWYG